jgi:hypothetical protein
VPAALPHPTARFTLGRACLCGLAVLGGCRHREPSDVARTRAGFRFLEEQVKSLETLVAKAERGELGMQDQIAVGVSEEVVNGLLTASLPQEVVLAGRVRLRLESGRALFRGNQAALVLRAGLSSTRVPQAWARAELGGILGSFEIQEGKLLARALVAHFSVIEASGGDLGADVVEGLVRQNLGLIDAAIPALVIPVSLEQSVRIDGLTEGAVVTRPGVLPLTFEVAHVIPTGQRLWVLLAATAGPWQPLPPEERP